MSDDSRRGSESTAIFVLLLLPVIYMLSIGPVIFAVEKLHAKSAMQKPVMTFYAPILWLHEHTALKKPIDRYVDWWVKLASL
jgi:hypothetical protein